MVARSKARADRMRAASSHFHAPCSLEARPPPSASAHHHPLPGFLPSLYPPLYPVLYLNYSQSPTKRQPVYRRLTDFRPRSRRERQHQQELARRTPYQRTMDSAVYRVASVHTSVSKDAMRTVMETYGNMSVCSATVSVDHSPLTSSLAHSAIASTSFRLAMT